MRLRRWKGPNKAFSHQEGCTLFLGRPEFPAGRQEVERGFWRGRSASAASKPFREIDADDRVRLDPLDPKRSHHLGQCEYISETDPAVLKVLLKVKPGLGPATIGSSAARAAPAGRSRTTRASGDDEPAGAPRTTMPCCDSGLVHEALGGGSTR
jgi:hypothetical protein